MINKIKNNIGTIIFILVLVVGFIAYTNQVKTFNDNLARCGHNYCEVSE